MRNLYEMSIQEVVELLQDTKSSMPKDMHGPFFDFLAQTWDDIKIVPITWALVMTYPGTMKIHCIKWVRKYTGLGLKEAKDFVESFEVKPPMDREIGEIIKYKSVELIVFTSEDHDDLVNAQDNFREVGAHVRIEKV